MRNTQCVNTQCVNTSWWQGCTKLVIRQRQTLLSQVRPGITDRERNSVVHADRRQGMIAKQLTSSKDLSLMGGARGNFWEGLGRPPWCRPGHD